MEADMTFEIVDESEELEFDLTEAALKPEQEKTVRPIYDDPLEVLPDAGKVLSKVTVSPIPEPTDIVTLTENDTFDVRRVGTAVVNVPQGVFPEGTLDITGNGTYDVTDYESAHVNIIPTVEPVVLDSVNVAELPEPINRVVFDISKYDLSNYHLVWLECNNIVLSVSDWLYFSAGDNVAYTSKVISQEFFIKTMFTRCGEAWYNMVKYAAPSAYQNNGDSLGIGDVQFFLYSSATKIMEGEFKLYAL